MLAASTDTLPLGEGWVYEPKWDGFRAIVTVSGGEVTLTSRNGNDLTDRFRAVARAAALAIRPSDAVLDGEICALDESGRSRFSLLQESAGTEALVLFDLLELESERLVDEPLVERRRRLEQLVGRSSAVLVSPQFDDGEALLAAARQQELEGRRRQAGELALPVGTSLSGVAEGQAATDAGGRDRGVHARSGSPGRVRSTRRGGTGRGCSALCGETSARASPMREIERLRGLLEPLERADPPFADVPKMPRVRRSDITWVEPVLVAEVEFAEWTHEGRLRAPSYLRLREDRVAADVSRERAPLASVVKRGKRELRFSNLDKPFWPELGITKGDLIAYYRDVAEDPFRIFAGARSR